MLKIDKISKSYRNHEYEQMTLALKSTNLTIRSGEFLGLVGESGCGKTTLGKVVSGVIRADTGELSLDGDVLTFPYRPEVHTQIQYIFQLPQKSFNPMKRVGNSLVEIVKYHQSNPGIEKEAVLNLFKDVGLSESHFHKYPHQLSGGESQRVAIARALLCNPKLIVCDEITSALDKDVQEQIVSLFRSIRKKYEISILFISHDISLVMSICDTVAIMKEGEIVELGTVKDIKNKQDHIYTRKLFADLQFLEGHKETSK